MDTENDKIDLSKFISTLKKGWYHYAIAFVLFTILAILYNLYRTPKYVFHSSILIETSDDSSSKSMGGGMSQLMRTFSIGGMSSASVDNEILIFQTRDIISKMIRKLDLNVNYAETSSLKKKYFYKNSPILVTAPSELFDTLQSSFKIKIDLKENNKVDIDVCKGIFSSSIIKYSEITLPYKLKTPFGEYLILKTESFKHLSGNGQITATITGSNILAEYYSKQIVVDYASKKADAIELTVEDADITRGKDILNSMMSLYNEFRLNRKNIKTSDEIDFLDNQIKELSIQLSDSEKKVEEFKNTNKLTNIEAEAQLLLSANQDAQSMLMNYKTQTMVYDMILNILNQNNDYTMLPIIPESGATDLITKYNELIIRKLDIDISAKKDNYAQKSLIEKINAMKNIVKESILKLKENTHIAANNISTRDNKFSTKLNKLPEFERKFFDLMRDKGLKNDLYVFLLEKRASSQLKMASNIAPGLIIDSAYNDTKPIPTKTYISIIAVIIATMVIPTFIILFISYIKKHTA